MQTDAFACCPPRPWLLDSRAGWGQEGGRGGGGNRSQRWSEKNQPRHAAIVDRLRANMASMGGRTQTKKLAPLTLRNMSELCN